MGGLWGGQNGRLGRAVGVVAILVLAIPVGAQEVLTDPRAARDREAEAREEPLKWFLLVGMVNVYPNLESEELIDRYFEPVLKLLAPGHGGVYTVSDLRDDHLLWPPQLGVGRVLSDRWAVFFHMAYGSGKVRTKADDLSIFLVPLHTDFEIKRGAFAFGIGADCLPFGMAELRAYEGLKDRLRSAKPALGTRLTWTYATFDAKVKLGVPLGNFLNIELSDSWFLPSLNLNVGVDVPVNRRNVLTFNAGYNFFWEEEQDFGGTAFTVALKHFFR